MPDPRLESAWRAELQRRSRARRAYWLGIGEIDLFLCAWSCGALALISLFTHRSQP
jgi:hypothetical protein